MRCRDMTCRFPGCDEPAHHCDIDHTIAYPTGPTQASNLKCLAENTTYSKHSGAGATNSYPTAPWIWTSPHGQTYTTQPGSRILFPTLCRPTAAPVAERTRTDYRHTNRGVMMPRRKSTRAENQARAIEDERRHNQTLINTETKVVTEEWDRCLLRT